MSFDTQRQFEWILNQLCLRASWIVDFNFGNVVLTRNSTRATWHQSRAKALHSINMRIYRSCIPWISAVCIWFFCHFFTCFGFGFGFALSYKQVVYILYNVHLFGGAENNAVRFVYRKLKWNAMPNGKRACMYGVCNADADDEFDAFIARSPQNNESTNEWG